MYNTRNVRTEGEPIFEGSMPEKIEREGGKISKNGNRRILSAVCPCVDYIVCVKRLYTKTNLTYQARPFQPYSACTAPFPFA